MQVCRRKVQSAAEEIVEYFYKCRTGKNDCHDGHDYAVVTLLGGSRKFLQVQLDPEKRKKARKEAIQNTVTILSILYCSESNRLRDEMPAEGSTIGSLIGYRPSPLT